MRTNEILEEIFDDFEENDVEYAIMRNWDFLLNDELYEGQDVDILVYSKDKDTIRTIMKLNGLLERKVNPFTGHMGFEKFVHEDEKNLRLHFHVNGVSGNHVAYIDAKDVLPTREKESFFYRVSDYNMKKIVYHHCLFDKKEISPKYQKVLGIKKFSDVAIEQKRIFLFKNCIKIAFVYFFAFIWKLFNLAPVVSFIGMDGAGKSTQLNYLQETLKKNYIKHVLIYGGRGRNNVLPIQSVAKVVKPNKFTKFLSAPVFALDLFFRYWIKIFPQRFFNDLVIVDRSSSDILLMKHVPMWLKRFMFFFLPKANKYIYLYNDVDVLAKRKDHPIEDLKRQEELFLKVNSILKPIKIKSEEKEQTRKLILSELLGTSHYLNKGTNGNDLNKGKDLNSL